MNIGLTALHTLAFLVMLSGLVSLLVPIFPGLVVIWIAVLVDYLVMGFSPVTGFLFAFITMLMIIGNLVDNLLMGGSARVQGASWGSLGLALAAGIAGSFLLPPLGGLIGALLGLFVSEAVRSKDWLKAFETTTSMVKGWGWAVLARVGIGVVMITLWVVSIFVF